ncbi:MAG: aromatic ring-hydroxylating dioxygenase subunit alpha [Alphaproteobacteria bacterium]|nr:aromatic ring-hydroxylating dioxygenase subunit alpha [Alphaproteobacteria bacterium]
MTNTELIYDAWYVAAHAKALARGKTKKVQMLGVKLLLGRSEAGEPFALRDFCPHRGIPLSYGTFDGKEIECCYHGWRFDCSGQCTAIPSLSESETVDISRIRAQSFPCREHYGLIWVYVPAPKTRAPENLPPLPAIPAHPALDFDVVDSVHLPCPIDHAVIGLMDPSHGPFVHASWWWRSTRSMHEKQKHFAPTTHGFKMAQHKPSSNSRAYKILGGDRTTEIAFELPGFRTEHITVGHHHIILLTALTPEDEKNTRLHQFVFTTIPLLKLLMPLLKPFGRKFIQQDVKVVKMQQEGLVEGHPSLMLLGDADQQALWYFKIKREFIAAQAAREPFVNPIKEKVLRWKS